MLVSLGKKRRWRSKLTAGTRPPPAFPSFYPPSFASLPPHNNNLLLHSYNPCPNRPTAFSMDTKRTRRPMEQPPVAAVLFLLLLTHRYASAQSPPQSDSRDGYYNNGRFSPTMAIIIVAMISAFFLLGFFSIYLRSCGSDEESLSFRRRAAAGRSRRQQQGLNPDVIETFPTMVYSEVKGLKVGKGALECAVCLCEFEDDEELRLLPHCNHVFHPDCIDAWLAAHVTCPVCRANLTEQATAASADPGAPPAVAQEAPGVPAPDHVAIAVDPVVEEDEQKEAAVELARIGSQRRAARSRSGRRPVNFPRSHSTGHSMTRPVEDADRFTLRLPEHIRKEILASRKFHRSTSCISFPTPNEGSSRSSRRGRGRPERSIQLGRSERWPSFLLRNLSIKIPAWAIVKRGEGEGSASGSGSASVRKGEIDVSSKGTAAYPRALSESPGASDAFASTATANNLESPAGRRRPKSPRPT